MKLLVINLYNLGCTAKTTRWGITGSYFYGLHQLLDELDVWARKQGDLIAERMVLLGQKPSVLSSVLAENNFIDPSPLSHGHYEWDVEFLILNMKDLQNYCDLIRGDHGHCENSLLTDLQRGLDEQIKTFSKIIGDNFQFSNNI